MYKAKERFCMECNTDISHRDKRKIYCKECETKISIIRSFKPSKKKGLFAFEIAEKLKRVERKQNEELIKIKERYVEHFKNKQLENNILINENNILINKNNVLEKRILEMKHYVDIVELKNIELKKQINVSSGKGLKNNGIICPYCNAKSKVIDAKRGKTNKRRRECISCKQRWNTYERLE